MLAGALALAVNLAHSEEPATPQQVINGEVLETLDVPGYTYVRIKAGAGEVWAAVETAKLTPGQSVTIENAALFDNFKSNALKRTFNEIYFGNLPVVKLTQEQAQERIAQAHAAAAKARVDADKPIVKASGPQGRTVAEVVNSAPDFKDVLVTVRARVIKANSGIMGKTWLHLQDGSGDAANASNDLIITTREPADVGEVLLVTGTVRKDKDFGAGYAYKVMLEDATLQR